MKKILGILIFVFGLSGVQTLYGQSKGEIAVKVVAPVILQDRLEVYMPLSPIPKDDPSSYNGDWQKLSLNAYDFGAWNKVRVGESRVLRFYAEASAVSKELGIVKLSSAKKQLLFFVGNHKEKLYRVLAIKDSAVAWGEYGVFNSTSSPMRFDLGKTKKMSKPNAFTVLVPPGEIFEMKAHAQFDGKVKKVYHTKWRITKRHREFVFCMQQPGSTRINWIHVRDRKVEKVPAAQR